LPEDLYVELLCFITVNWKKLPTHMQNENLFRHITSSGNRGMESASNVVERTNTGLASVSNVVDGITIYISS
jgi:hypothetical protein